MRGDWEMSRIRVHEVKQRIDKQLKRKSDVHLSDSILLCTMISFYSFSCKRYDLIFPYGCLMLSLGHLWEHPGLPSLLQHYHRTRAVSPACYPSVLLSKPWEQGR